MGQVSYDTHSLSDQRIIEALDKIASALAAESHPESSYTLVLASNHQFAIALRTRADPKNVAFLDRLREVDQSVLTNASAVLLAPERLDLTINRQAGRCEVRATLKDGIAAERAVEILGAVYRALPSFDRPAEIERTLGPELAEFYRRREEVLLRLDEVVQKQIERNEEHRRKQDVETDDIRGRLRAEAEAQTSRSSAELDTKQRELDERESALNERTKKLDDRAAKHARRQIYSDFKGLLTSRGKTFVLTESTVRKRRPIHTLFWFAVALGTLAFGEALYRHLNGDASVQLLVRLLITFAGLAATVIYYIRWNDRWFREHAEEEFRLKRLELDIDRASWVVELAMEWKQERSDDLPAELLSRLTANLFREARPYDAVRHPSEDALSAILGNSSELRVRLPQGEALLKRSGVRRAMRETQIATDSGSD